LRFAASRRIWFVATVTAPVVTWACARIAAPPESTRIGLFPC
jgi:hypothetical protein